MKIRIGRFFRLSVFAACGIVRAGVAQTGESVELRIDFDRTSGVMLPLHGVNNAPMKHWGRQEAFVAAGIPFSRTHDSAGAYGGAHYIDIPNVFPDFDADENDSASYDFALTDAWLGTLVASGTEPFYRLGVTIEGGRRLIRAYHIFPPRDNAKWARIAEHVIRHYTEGWANGKKWKIRYWEIWNEPDNPDMWQGSMEQFFEFYKTVSRHLKGKFPHLKIGGYGSCGFKEADGEKIDPRYANGSYLDWFEKFVAYVNAPETKSPLDFFSWHVYTDNPEQLARLGRFCRAYLDGRGLKGTEAILNEWNFINHAKYGTDEFTLMKEMPGATFVASAFCLLQRDRSVSAAMFYDALPTRSYGALYYFPSMKTTPCYEAFRLFNGVYRLGTCVESAVAAGGVYSTAARNANQGACLVVNNNESPVAIQVKTRASPTSITLLSAEHPKTVTREMADKSIDLPAKSVALLKFNAAGRPAQTEK